MLKNPDASIIPLRYHDQRNTIALAQSRKVKRETMNSLDIGISESAFLGIVIVYLCALRKALQLNCPLRPLSFHLTLRATAK